MSPRVAAGSSSDRVVRAGQASTAGVITAAAAIMICMFVPLSLPDNRDIAEFGIGLAGAVARDLACAHLQPPAHRPKLSRGAIVCY